MTSIVYEFPELKLNGAPTSVQFVQLLEMEKLTTAVSLGRMVGPFQAERTH